MARHGSDAHKEECSIIDLEPETLVPFSQDGSRRGNYPILTQGRW